MAWLLLSFLTALCGIMILRALLVTERCYHFPFFAAGIFLTFILPQLPGIINDRFVDNSAIVKALVMSILCLAMCWAGWHFGMRSRPARNVAFSEKHLVIAAASMSLAGAYFFYQLGQLPDAERLKSMMTGRAVTYLFFAKLLTYGFAIALLCHALRPSKVTLLIILFDAAFYFERIVIAGRRGETAEFFILIALAFWFQRGWVVPRPAILAGLTVALAGLLGAGEYRQATFYTGEPNWKAVMQIDLGEKWKDLLQEGGPEMVNAAKIIGHVDQTKAFDLGINHWNWTVFAYVPAQLVGRSFKEALMLEQPPMFERGYEPPIGSTATGMADAFVSFWYFGCAKFFAIAWIMGWLYTSATRGNTATQLAYMLLAVPSILSISHFTHEIVIAGIHLAIFLVPTLFLASAGVRRARTLSVAKPAVFRSQRF